GPHRLWWACAVYGHDIVRVLDGGFDAWVREGRPVQRGASSPRHPVEPFTPAFEPTLVAGIGDVEAAAGDPRTVILDSRPPVQYRGDAVWFETGPIPAGPDGVARTPRGRWPGADSGASSAIAPGAVSDSEGRGGRRPGPDLRTGPRARPGTGQYRRSRASRRSQPAGSPDYSDSGTCFCPGGGHTCQRR